MLENGYVENLQLIEYFYFC